MLIVKSIDGNVVPYCQCKACGEPITKERAGIAHFNLTADLSDAGVTFVHQGACDRAVDPDKRNGWMPLDVFLRCLIQNCGYSTAKLARLTVAIE
jgi:hypothetical protein